MQMECWTRVCRVLVEYEVRE
ncbi:hypothetical protein PUN28_002031 [Cardiocondyla obscurior]|uniref:Uncharacterized protein n=1 Tax=Cardiocondyla obscurior TaxID=286306 RepID=A0AAW2GSB3_9HYME